jgi:HSP20 family molecular chaperone IbpA
MYRFFLLFLLASAVAGHRWCEEHHSYSCSHRHHDYKNNHKGDSDFNKLSWDVVNTDRKINRICDKTKNYTESFMANSYKLSVPLPGFAEEDITVKMRHRVVLIQANKASENKLFSQMKIVPDFLNGNDAAWSLSEEILDINIPYKSALGTDVAKTCQIDIDEKEITVSKMDLDVRFGDDTTAAPAQNVV